MRHGFAMLVALFLTSIGNAEEPAAVIPTQKSHSPVEDSGRKPAKPRETNLELVEREAHAELIAIYAQLVALRNKKTSDDKWEAFRLATLPKLKAVSNRLERHATAKRPALQRLLWAGRDHLRLMLGGPSSVGARRGPNEDESKFLVLVTAAVFFTTEQFDEGQQLTGFAFESSSPGSRE